MMCPEIASRKSDGDDRTPQERIDAIHRPKWCVDSDDGRLYWELICAAIRNDVKAITEHLKRNPDCARLEFWYTPPIHFAVREGNLEATHLLWNVYPYEDVSDLITMADDRGLPYIAEFLRNSINNESHDADLRLHNAVQTRNYGVITRLLRANSGIADHRDSKGRTALHLAVIADNLRAVRSLIAAGVEIDPFDHYGFRPVHYACWRNQYWSFGKGGVALLNALIDAGAADSPTLAAARGDLNAVRAFVEANPAVVNDGESLQKRPLSAAVERGNREIVRCLLDAGADPNAGVDSSGTPATRASSDAMRGLLYEYGGRPEAAWGIAQRGDLETLAAILRYCDDPFSNEDSEFLTTPYTAIVSGCGRCLDKRESTDAHEAMLSIFLKRRFPMPKVLTECKGYLYHVPHMTCQLLESGLDPNLHDWQRRTPVHDLCSGLRHVEDPAGLIQMFIQHGAEVNSIDEEDRSTPLGIAAREGDARLVKLLLENGANPNTAGADWATPLAWAQRRGNDQVTAILRECGAV